MKSIWYQFIEDFQEQIPLKPLSVILEAFCWYMDINKTEDILYSDSCKDMVYKLMGKDKT